MFRVPMAWMLVVALPAGGCCHNPHDHGGEFVVEYKAGDKPDTTTAPYKATYALYQWSPLPEGPPPPKWIPEHEVSELYVRGLKRWDKIGFEKVDGKIVAVAGDEKIPLDDGRYCWHITTETEYRGGERVLHEAGENVLYIVSLPFAAVGCAVVAVIVLPILAVVGVGALACIPAAIGG